jgi:hemerythrin
VINRETLKLVWDDAYRSGNRVIDTQHRQLFDLGNSLLDAIRRKEQDSEIAFFLDTLMADLSHHFRTEEEEMLKVGHKLGKSHRDEHRALEARARRLRVQFEEGQLSLEDLFGFFANDVLALHIAQEHHLFGRQA